MTSVKKIIKLSKTSHLAFLKYLNPEEFNIVGRDVFSCLLRLDFSFKINSTFHMKTF